MSALKEKLWTLRTGETGNVSVLCEHSQPGAIPAAEGEPENKK